MTYCRCYSCKYLLRYELKTERGKICAFFNCRCWAKHDVIVIVGYLKTSDLYQLKKIQMKHVG